MAASICLQKLQLKSVIWVAPEAPSERFYQFLLSHSIPLHQVCAQSTAGSSSARYTDPSNPIDEATVIAALHLLMRPSSYPCLVMDDNLGRHRTGTVVGCLRKLQVRLSLGDALNPPRG